VSYLNLKNCRCSLNLSITGRVRHRWHALGGPHLSGAVAFNLGNYRTLDCIGPMRVSFLCTPLPRTAKPKLPSNSAETLAKPRLRLPLQWSSPPFADQPPPSTASAPTTASASPTRRRRTVMELPPAYSHRSSPNLSFVRMF
jgi:hypothetical protein